MKTNKPNESIKTFDKNTKNVVATNIKIANTSFNVSVDSKLELTCSITPAEALQEAKWSVSDKSIAEIIEKGEKTYLKGKKAGNVDVTVTTKDGSRKSDTKQFNVTGKKKKRLLAALIPLGALVVSAAIITPTVFACKNKGSSSDASIVLKEGVLSQNVYLKEAYINKGVESYFILNVPTGKNIKKIEIQVGQTTLNEGDYKIEGSKVIIQAQKMTDTKIIVNSIELITLATNIAITNTIFDVMVDSKLELTCAVTPAEALQEGKWSVDDESKAEIVEEGGKTYLKGKVAGSVNVKVTTKDGSDKSDTKPFNVTAAVTTKTATLTYDTYLNDGKVWKITKDSYTANISNETDETKKITISCHASAPVYGIIQIYNGTTLLQETEVKTIGTTNSTIEVVFDKWDTLGATSSLDVKFEGQIFNNGDGTWAKAKKWTEVATACNEFEAKGATPSVQDAKNLCIALGIDNPTEEADAKTTLQTNLVGKEGKFIVNDLVHYVRCVDAMHDKIADSTTYSALTFDMITLLSIEKDGKICAMKCAWGKADDNTFKNYDYINNSTLRKSLTNEGNGEMKWYYTYLNGTSYVTEQLSDEKRCISDMLPVDLKSGIKSVTKEVATSNDSGASYSVNTYNTTLFSLTWAEMDYKDPTYSKEEGSVYKYWEGKAQADRVKHPVNANMLSVYWCSSPNIQSTKTDSANVINAQGIHSQFGIYQKLVAPSFGFCI